MPDPPVVAARRVGQVVAQSSGTRKSLLRDEMTPRLRPGALSSANASGRALVTHGGFERLDFIELEAELASETDRAGPTTSVAQVVHPALRDSPALSQGLD